MAGKGTEAYHSHRATKFS